MGRKNAFAPLVLLLALSGCGSRTAAVSGKVSYRGRTVTSGSVIFLHADGTARSGVIQPDGSYSVDGVKKGHVRIGVLSPDPAHARSILNVDENRAKSGHNKTKSAPPAGKAVLSGWFPLPESIRDPEKSGVECDVTASRVTYDIEMK